MECLQIISNLSNTEEDCPARAGRCELLFDADNVRMQLRLSLLTLDPKPAAMVFDVCCYDKDGCILSAMERVPYIDGGMLLEIPSLMTASVRVLLRRAEYESGRVWESSGEFPKKIETDADNAQNLDSTMRFDPNVLLEAVRTTEDEVEEPIVSKRAMRKAMKRKRREEDAEIRDFIKHDPHERKMRWLRRVIGLVVAAGLCVGGVYIIKYKLSADAAYKKAMNLYNSGKYEDAVPELENAARYKIFGGDKNDIYWCLGMGYAQQRNFKPAAVNFMRLNGYKESRANFRSIIEAYSGIISAGGAHTLGLKNDGTVVAAGDNAKGQCGVSSWNDMIAVSAGGEHSVGIKRGNTVVAVGNNADGQCDVSGWSDVISVSAGTHHTVGVKNVGRAVAAGDNTYGQCEVGEWSGLVSVSAGAEHTVGLKLDGTVVAAGNNSNGECNVAEWRDIAQVAAGNGFTAGLGYNGRIYIAGNIADAASEAKKVKNPLMISAGEHSLLIVTQDGRVTSVGGNESNQGMTNLWINIAAASGGTRHSVGVCEDGTVFAAGDNSAGQTSLDGWQGIGIPKSTVTIRKGE